VTSAELARLLVEAGAVEVRADPAQWFTWSSGRRAPIYCDNRILISLPDVRARVVEALRASVAAHFPGAEAIAGTATAGIPWAAWLADRMALPMLYVRSSAKEHGRGRRVEGRPPRGERVVLIEDLISFGGSSLGAVRRSSRRGPS
jgi:orotate phosphoribosyltransferase